MDNFALQDMSTVFIIHGSYGHPQENWFPWLKKKLETLGHKVIVPKFPIHANTANNHRLDEWFEEFDKYKEFINEETIVIAHSRGCSFAFQLLPILGIKINSLFLVGPFVDYDQWRPDIYKDYDSFQARPCLLKRLRQLVKHIEIFQSTNDVIPVSEGQFIADCLHSKITIVKNAGHFNVATYKRYIKFPLLLKHIKKIQE